MSLLQPLKDMTAKMVTMAFHIYKLENLDGSYTTDSNIIKGIQWAVRIQSNKTSKAQKRKVSIALVCNPNNTNDDWSVSASFGFRFMNSWGNSKNKISPHCTHTFNSKENFKGPPVFCNWDDLMTPNSGFIIDGTFVIEVDLNVSRTVGIKKEGVPKKFFDKFLADGKLIVEDQSVNICIPFLAAASPAFYQLLYVDNPGKKEFDFFDFSLEAVQGMVAIVHLENFDITINNYQDMLDIGQRYALQSVMEKCEKFLLKTRKVSLDNKLKLSEKYLLPYLQFRTTERLLCIEHVECILDENIDLGEKTCEILMDRIRYLKFKNADTSCSCKRPHRNRC